MPQRATTEDYRREYPRIPVTLPVEVQVADGARIHVKMCNISRAGMQLACDPMTVNRLLPGGQMPLPSQPVTLDVRFELPLSGQEVVPVSVRCNAIFSRRVAQNEFRLGLQFASFEAEGFDHIENYIQECTGQRSF
ncbi:MAG: PilZ domain-containing protein [Gammaproteobacteria bacterium]|nr:PilZ domain-containing protein [Gammaproteobacteria bacterium]NIR83723.1 PilZ domain-containing protein [Gammaproteobacteria bacterium]NIR91870.1 PilZ domain-containing protein [Gammaproteobacteria bacterium]NIU04889.1 PilZ domain-containing protein [Gammaproteobacteria bacterium]NIV51871.1 hypothetical protein [Gammaproteobacteria bacterium]